MNLEEKVRTCINLHGLLKPGGSVICGLSGGADSICLAYTLKKLGYNVYAIHVQHGIRGEEALSDAEFAENFCKSNGITFFTEHINVPELAKKSKLSLETCARIERYRIFEEFSLKFNCPIAVAHNKNDQAETVLMHLIRGSGLNGLCGMEYRSGNIIRPLLDVSRNEIEDYLSELSLAYVTDSTNSDKNYTRNRVRLEIIPEMEKINPGVTDSICSCASLLKNYKDYFDKTADEKFASLLLDYSENKVKITLCELDSVIRDSVIRKAFLYLNGNTVNLEKVHIAAVSELFTKQSGKEICLPQNICVRREFDTLVFFKKNETKITEEKFIPQKTCSWQNGKIYSQLVDRITKVPNTEYADLDKLPENMCIRTRRSGDRISPLGLNGSQALKKYFINKKIPKEERDTMPLIVSGNEILVVFGHTVSEKIKVTENTKNILKICKE